MLFAAFKSEGEEQKARGFLVARENKMGVPVRVGLGCQNVFTAL